MNIVKNEKKTSNTLRKYLQNKYSIKNIFISSKYAKTFEKQ